MRPLLTFLAWALISYSYGQWDRSKPPSPGIPKKVTIGKYNNYKLENGLNVILVNDQGANLLKVGIYFDYVAETKDISSGLADFTVSLLGTGSQNFTKDSLNSRIDYLGLEKYYDEKAYTFTGLPKYQDDILEILSEIILNPRFDSTEIKKMKTMVASALAYRRKDQSLMAERVIYKLIYGERHPYGQIYNEQTVNLLAAKDCYRFHEKYIRPNNASLVIVGNFNDSSIHRSVNHYFSAWKQGQEYKLKLPEIKSKQKVYLMDKAESVQSTVRIAHAVDFKVGDENYLPGIVANTILGGGTYRLFTILREEKAYTYGAYSSLVDDPYKGYFEVATDVRTEVTDSAIYYILREMSRISNERATLEEINAVKNYIIGNFAVAMEKSTTLASLALECYKYQLPENYFDRYIDNLQAITAEQIQQAAMQTIRPETSIIVVVGRTDSFKESLMKMLPDAEFYFIDADGNKIE